MPLPGRSARAARFAPSATPAMTWPSTTVRAGGTASTGTYALGAGVRRRGAGTWIGRPSATSAASLTASPSVGCAAMESPTVSTVASPWIPTTPALIVLARSGPWAVAVVAAVGLGVAPAVRVARVGRGRGDTEAGEATGQEQRRRRDRGRGAAAGHPVASAVGTAAPGATPGRLSRVGLRHVVTRGRLGHGRSLAGDERSVGLLPEPHLLPPGNPDVDERPGAGHRGSGATRASRICPPSRSRRAKVPAG